MFVCPLSSASSATSCSSIFLSVQHQNPRGAGVENRGIWPVKRLLAELGLGVPRAMFRRGDKPGNRGLTP